MDLHWPWAMPVALLCPACDVWHCVSMQRLSTTITVTLKGRIINSYTVDYWTAQTPERVKVINGHPKGKPWNLPPARVEPWTCKPKLLIM
jgi:hypothetical protein